MNKLGPVGLMESCVEDTGGGVVVVVGVVVVGVVVVEVGVVVVEGFSPPLPPHAAVSPPSAIRALVPATAARQRTLRDLIVFPIGTVAANADFCTLQETRNLTDGIVGRHHRHAKPGDEVDGRGVGAGVLIAGHRE